MVSIRLAEPEARVLEAFARRQLTWDAGQAAHVVTAHQALGVFTAPPLGVLVFLAIPTAEHYLPLLYALALKEKNDPITLFNDKAIGGSLTMTSLKIGA